MFSFWDKFCYILICSFPFSFKRRDGDGNLSFLLLAGSRPQQPIFDTVAARRSVWSGEQESCKLTLNKNHQAHPIRKAQEHAWLLQFLCWSQCFFLHDPSKSNKTNNVLYANGDHESTYFDEVLPSYILKNASSNALKRQPSVSLFN